MASKRRRSDSNDVQPRYDALQVKAGSASDDSETEQVTNVRYKSKLELYNRPIIVRGGIYEGRLKEGQIRILVLYPGSGSNEIKCELRTESHHKGLKYEALSYHWGGQEKIDFILLRGIHFAVTHNLAEALRYLRDPQSEKLLWVDAICLNQYDQEEKELQLELMHLIYERASTTTAWLGLPNDATERAFLGMNRSLSAGGPQIGTLVTGKIIAGRKAAPGNDGDFGELMARPYWTRAWIVQEIMCAKFLLIQCGHDITQYKALEEAFPPNQPASVETNSEDRECETGYITFHGEAEVKIVRRESKMLSSKHYLDDFLDRQCGLRHDNIYAFLHLLRSDVKPRKPSYDIDIRKLVLQTALEIIKSTKSLHIIIIKGRQEPPHAREEAWQRDMPSWCPYLATPYSCRPINVENGPHLSAETAVFSIVKKRFKIRNFSIVKKRLEKKEVSVVMKMLQVRGFVIGKVSRTISQRIPPKFRASIHWSHKGVERELAHYRKCLAMGLRGVPKDENSRTMSMVATTRTLLVVGRDEDDGILAGWKTSFRDLDQPEKHLLRQIFKNRISRSVCSFDLSLTTKKALNASEVALSAKLNRVALVPHMAEEGDDICVVLGCSTPVVLRNIGDHYTVLGEAYIDTSAMGEFNIPVSLRDFVLGGDSLDGSERFAWRRNLARRATPL